MVIHDDELDRTTTCTGSSTTRRSPSSLPAGSTSRLRGRRRADSGRSRPSRFRRLTDVIDAAQEDRREGQHRGQGPGRHVPAVPAGHLQAARGIGHSVSRITVQNFKPDSLTRHTTLYPGVTTSYLTLSSSTGPRSPRRQDGLRPGVAAVAGRRGVRGRGQGRRPDDRAVHDRRRRGIEAADALGVDAMITNDPTLSQPAGRAEAEPQARRSCKGPAEQGAPGREDQDRFVRLQPGEGQSVPGRVSIKFNRKSLKRSGPVSKTVPVLKTEEEFDTNFRLKVERGAKRFGKFPVTLTPHAGRQADDQEGREGQGAPAPEVI